jgi:hypothetical protein
MFVGAKGGGIGDTKTGYTAATQSSISKNSTSGKEGGRGSSRGTSSMDFEEDERRAVAEEK